MNPASFKLTSSFSSIPPSGPTSTSILFSLVITSPKYKLLDSVKDDDIDYLSKEEATNTYVNKSFLEGTTETTLKEVTDKYQTAETSDSKYLKPSNFGVEDINT